MRRQLHHLSSIILYYKAKSLRICLFVRSLCLLNSSQTA